MSTSPVADPAQVVDQLAALDPLEQEAGRADPERLVEVLLVVVHGEEDDLAAGAPQDLAHRSSPLASRSRTSSSTASGFSSVASASAAAGSLASPTIRTWSWYGCSMAFRPSSTIW